MAKYTIMMSCGHEDTVELFGKHQNKLSYRLYGEKEKDYGRT